MLSPPPTWLNLILHCPGEIPSFHPGDPQGPSLHKLAYSRRLFQQQTTSLSLNTACGTFGSRQPASGHPTVFLGQHSGIHRPWVGCGWPWFALRLFLSGSGLSTASKSESALTRLTPLVPPCRLPQTPPHPTHVLHALFQRLSLTDSWQAAAGHGMLWGLC